MQPLDPQLAPRPTAPRAAGRSGKLPSGGSTPRGTQRGLVVRPLVGVLLALGVTTVAAWPGSTAPTTTGNAAEVAAAGEPGLVSRT